MLRHLKKHKQQTYAGFPAISLFFFFYDARNKCENYTCFLSISIKNITINYGEDIKKIFIYTLFIRVSILCELFFLCNTLFVFIYYYFY